MEEFQGFFKLYYYNTEINNKKYFYNKSYNCAKCDTLFKEQFEKKIYIDITVYHLGKNNVNWNGRKDIDFIIDTKIKN
jgi:hypothetical protein